MSRPTTGVVIVVVLIGSIILGWTITREDLASGSGKKGEWRVAASWSGNYCLKRFHRLGEGGACGFAQPGTLNESLSWRVYRKDAPFTLVGGPVPPGATRVVVVPKEGASVTANLARVLGMTFYVAEVRGVQAIQNIQAIDDEGRVIQAFDLPPPGPY